MTADLSDLLQPLRSARVDPAFIEIGAGAGVGLASARGAFLHLLIAGRGEIVSPASDRPVALDTPGDYVLVLDVRPHRLATPGCADAPPSDYFRKGHDHDSPPTIRFGSGRVGLRTLSARLRIDPSNPLVRALPGTIAMSGAGGPVPPAFAAGLQGPGATAIVTALIDLLVLHAVRAIGLPMFAGGAERPAGQLRVPLVRSLIDANLQRRWTLAALAAEIGVSRSTLAAEFAAQAGQTPLAYVTARRMARARDALRGSALPVAEIAWRVGYDSGAAFARAFKRHFGQTPAGVRALAEGASGAGAHRHLHWSAFLDGE